MINVNTNSPILQIKRETFTTKPKGFDPKITKKEDGSYKIYDYTPGVITASVTVSPNIEVILAGPETTFDYVDNTGKIWPCPQKGWRMKYEKIKALENDGRLFMEGKS